MTLPTVLTPNNLDEDLFEQLFVRKNGVRPPWALSEENLEEELEQVPLFMRSSPNSIKCENTALLALQALDDDGDDNSNDETKCKVHGPLSLFDTAERLKSDANRLYTAKKVHRAIGLYSRALHLLVGYPPDDCQITVLVSIILGNRAAAHWFLKNYFSCARDCLRAVSLDPANRAAMSRLGRSLLRSSKPDRAVVILERLIKTDVKNGLKTLTVDVAALCAARAACATADVVAAATGKSLADAAEAQAARLNGWRRFGVFAILDQQVQQRHIEEAAASDGPRIQPDSGDDGGVAPSVACVVMYPEFDRYDVITAQDTSVCIYNVLKPLLASPAPWDPKHTYRPGNVRVFRHSYSRKKVGTHPPNSARGAVEVGRRHVEVDINMTLLQVMQMGTACLVNYEFELIVLHCKNEFSRVFLS